MSRRDDQQLRTVWAPVFSRKGGADSVTRLWEDWNEEIRSSILEKVVLVDQEEPVILSGPDSGDCAILTTRRLYFGGKVIDICEIMDVRPVEFTRRPKEKLNELDVVTRDGGFLRLTSSPGSGYFGLWNVLLHIARSNRISAGMQT
jgi:hypothetical protein